MHRHLAAALAATLAIAAIGATAASGERVRVGKLVLTIGGNVSPKRLPAKRFAPIALKLNGHVRTTDGTHPPAARRIVLEFDRDGTLFTRGLPICKPARLEARTTRAALRACKKALVGRGVSKAEVAFPEQAPFTASGPLLIFNGPKRGRQPSVVMHVYAFVPAPTAFVLRGKISNVKGRRFGKRIAIGVPVIAGGSGSLTDFNAKIRRFWSYKGKRRSYLIARCRDRRFVARGKFRFSDGSAVTGNVLRRCRRS